MTGRFQFVAETDAFLKLFPHRYDYIWADHPDPICKDKLHWKTESRHPLSDRLIGQGAYLYGVRFGPDTQYCLVDIDIGSRYHPRQDPFAISRMLAALEPLGLVTYVACTSSYSGGIHLYFPFQQPQKSWQLAIVVQTLLENAGFKLLLGHLEVFPNDRPYSADGIPNLYAAHRLPMQSGSYLLNSDWQPTYSTPTHFVEQWCFAQSRNTIDAQILECTLKASRRKRYSLSGKADKFLNDLNVEIEAGWTGYGQTNYILGRIALRSYVFGHILYAAQPLEGRALVEDILRVATSLPGYQQWCRHQHEIEKRVEEWAQCVEQSHYFHFGVAKSTSATSPSDEAVVHLPVTPSWNQQQSFAARDRIRAALADLIEHQSLPVGVTARFRALVAYGIGGSSLYRHRDLWHPTKLTTNSPVEIPPDPPVTYQEQEEDCRKRASSSKCSTSLLAEDGRNPGEDTHSSDPTASSSSSPGRNSPSLTPPVENRMAIDLKVPEGIEWVQQALFDAQSWLSKNQVNVERHRQLADRTQVDAQEAAFIKRMQQYLDSGDPILMAEARAFMRYHPGILQERSLSDEGSRDGRSPVPT